MTVLIKAAAAGGNVRPIAVVRPVPAGRADAAAAAPEEKPLSPLERENGELRDALAAARDAADEAAGAARELGRKEAVEQFRRQDQERLDALERGVAAALCEWRDRLAALDRLAPLLAQAAMAKLFDRCEDYTDLVTRSISRQLSNLGREAVVAIHVSGEDFPDAAALADLREDAGAGVLDVLPDADLAAGECRMKLRLGHLDIGVPSQWRELSALLDDAAFEELPS